MSTPERSKVAPPHRVKIHTVGGVTFELPSEVTAWWLVFLFKRTALALGFSPGKYQVPSEFRSVRADCTRHDLANCIGVFSEDHQRLARITPVSTVDDLLQPPRN